MPCLWPWIASLAEAPILDRMNHFMPSKVVRHTCLYFVVIFTPKFNLSMQSQRLRKPYL